MNEIKNAYINNDASKDMYVKDVLIFKTDDLDSFGIDLNDIRVFKSNKYKNGIPEVININKNKSKKVIISDSLTIIGNDKNALLIGFLGYNHLVETKIYVNKNKIILIEVYAIVNKLLKPNESFTSEDLLIETTTNINESIKKFALKKANKSQKVKSPIVYSTWYYYGEKITFDDCLTNLENIKNKNLNVDVFLLDDGYEKYYGTVENNDKFPSLEKVVDTIKSYNLNAGIWTAPFIMSKDSKLALSHPEWILKDNKNKPIIFKVNHKKSYVIDITIPETLKYFKMLYSSLYNMGFRFFKIDFTRAIFENKNANYFNKYINIVECYRNVIKEIKESILESYLLICGGLYDPLIGIVNASRTGKDIVSKWNKNTITTLKQSLYRYYYNYWWDNDADSISIRINKNKKNKLAQGLLNDIEANTIITNTKLVNGLISFTEPLDKIDDNRLNLLKKSFVKENIEFSFENILNDSNMIVFNVNDYKMILNLTNKDIVYNGEIINPHEFKKIGG